MRNRIKAAERSWRPKCFWAMGMFWLLSISLSYLQAQQPKSVVQGKILDQSRTPIAGARIVVTPESGTAGLTDVSGPTGEFLLTLEVGKHLLAVTADGFKDAKEPIVVAEAVGAPIEILLQVSEVRTTISVTESAGYQVITTNTATKTATPLIDIPQSITIVSRELIRDQLMMGMADVVRYVPGITMAQGEGHRDAPVIRGNATTSDFYVNGVRDDVQYFRDLYNLERVEAIKGPNAMIFGRGGGGGVINRVTKEAGFSPLREISLQGGTFGNKRVAGDLDQPIGDKLAFRLNGMYEDSNSFRNYFNLERYGIAPTFTIAPDEKTSIRLGYEYFHDGRLTDRGVPSYQGRPAVTHRSTFFGNPNESSTRADVHLGSAVVERQLGAALNIRNNTLFGAYDKFYQNVFPGAVNATATLVSLSGYNNGTQRNNVFNQTDVTYSAHTGPIRHTLLWGAEIRTPGNGQPPPDRLLQQHGYVDQRSILQPHQFHSGNLAPIGYGRGQPAGQYSGCDLHTGPGEPEPFRSIGGRSAL